ncbi:MAG: ACT domain-containing protein, partial [Microvirgula sp.]
AAKLIRYSNNGSTLSAVNFPEASLPAHPGTARLLHIHENQPGVLAAINETFGRLGINISAQYLQTTPTLGYVVIDTDSPAPEAAVEALSAVPGTIRCRVVY